MKKCVVKVFIAIKIALLVAFHVAAVIAPTNHHYVKASEQSNTDIKSQVPKMTEQAAAATRFFFFLCSKRSLNDLDYITFHSISIRTTCKFELFITVLKPTYKAYLQNLLSLDP